MVKMNGRVGVAPRSNFGDIFDLVFQSLQSGQCHGSHSSTFIMHVWRCVYIGASALCVTLDSECFLWF